MIEKDLTNQDAMRDTKISANVLIKLRNEQYCFAKTESTCISLDCTPNDVLKFIPEDKK